MRTIWEKKWTRMQGGGGVEGRCRGWERREGGVGNGEEGKNTQEQLIEPDGQQGCRLWCISANKVYRPISKSHIKRDRPSSDPYYPLLLTGSHLNLGPWAIMTALYRWTSFLFMSNWPPCSLTVICYVNVREVLCQMIAGRLSRSHRCIFLCKNFQI